MINFMFGIHNHQPVGNFDWVFQQSYKDCYLPFIEVLEKYPKVRVCLHYTGPLLEWIEENHPEYFDKLRKLLERNQIELMGGGFYEPLLPVVPKRDALGQIKMMQDYIKDKFGVIPKGMWLAERVWEPSLVSIIAEAGLKYVTIDDTHFYYAGFKTGDMFGYYITEDQGQTIGVFPIDKELRYRVPFRLAEETIEYFKTVPDGRAVTLADDGEKFGVWPGTHKWVYTDGYLEHLFELLGSNSDWLHMSTFSEYMERYPPMGKVYLPTASYDEMMEWSLPVDAQATFSSIVEEFKNKNQYDRMRPYLRGGFWRNFLVKYTESNKMYSKMIHVSNLVEKSGNPEAQTQLYKAQCNCAYWHGLFGGLYLSHLRHAIYEHLISAENLIESTSRVEEKDYNFDGFKEILFSSKGLNLYISPAYGGHILELDYKPKRFNLTNVLTRRPEAYHQKIGYAITQNPSAQPRSIHDMVQVKEEGLQDILFYDWYQRNTLIDHILDPSTTIEKFSQARYQECGDFVDKPYVVLRCDNSNILLMREGKVFEKPFVIKKSIDVQGLALHISYELHNPNKDMLSIWFGVEFNLTLLAGRSRDKFYITSKQEPMDIKSELSDSNGLEIVDKAMGFKVILSWTRSGFLWRFPIETVSHSESGLERTYQGSCIMPSWQLEIGPKEDKDLKIQLFFQEI